MMKSGRFSEKRIAILIFLLGLIMSFMMPVWQTPDEHTHLEIIGESIGNNKFAANICDSMVVKNGYVEGHNDRKMSILDQKQILTERNTYSIEDMAPGKISISVIKHLPAILGMYMGILVDLPSYWVLEMGEIFSLLYYTVICYYALKLMPLKKGMLAMIMLLPMSLQQASSIGYDSVLIPLCFLMISYVFYLKYEKNSIEIKECVQLFAIWLIITYIKMPYLFLIFLIMIIPLDKYHVDLKFVEIDKRFIKKIRIPFMICMSILVIGSCYLFRDNKWIQIVYGFITEWKRGIYLLITTGATWWKFLMTSTVGSLGWLETSFPFIVIIYIYISLVGVSVVGDKSENLKLKKWDVFVILITIVSLCVFTTIALTNHTIMVTLYGTEFTEGSYNIREALYQIPYIGGVQGRYYLPFLGLFFLLIPRKIDVSNAVIEKVVEVGGICLYIYVVIVLLQRYWIV